MLLSARHWGPDSESTAVVCVHGVAHHGGIFEELAGRLAAEGHRVIAVDLRGHGHSEHLPPWSVATHISDISETVEACGVQRVSWVGHSFGGRIVAELASKQPSITHRLVLLDPGLEVPPQEALRRAEIDRREWSFATVDAAVRALQTRSVAKTDATEQRVRSFATGDLKKGADGRLRFSFCPAAAVVAWSEMSTAPPAIADCPTLLIRPDAPMLDGAESDNRYRDVLAGKLEQVALKSGHNLLWEAPADSALSIANFLKHAPDGGMRDTEPRQQTGE